MKRRIELYLGGNRADLPDDALVLYNWALTDMTNPTIVKNSFSHTFSLPRTPRNEAIFGHSGRLDRVAGSGGTGAAFNASRKLPFLIYSDAGEIIVSGYAKLDGVTDDAYNVSLFGGLGELLWGLSYDDAGEKKSLASLDYGEDLDFTINAATVEDAWARLAGDGTKDAKWDIINFAPAYNGIPTDFDAQHAVADASELGLTATIDGHTTKGGKVLVNLPEAVDEWAAKDLRSYLQRPVISMEAIIAACADPANNGGWTVTYPTLPYSGAWLTRPLLPSLGTYKQQTGGISATFVPIAVGTLVGQFSLSGVIPSSDVNATIAFRLAYNVSAGGATPLITYRSVISGGASYVDQQVLFVQAVGYDSLGNEVAAGPVRSFYYNYYNVAPADIAAAVGYTPEMGAPFAAASHEVQYNLSGGTYERSQDIALELTGRDLARIDILVTAARVQISRYNDSIRQVVTPAGSFPFATMWDTSANEYTPTLGYASGGAATGTSETTDTLRSGARITKQMLLSTSKTPAEYLISFCKMMGFYIVADAATRTAEILPREDFYLNETIDLTKRVDLSKGVEVTPVYFDAKWYDLQLRGVGGSFETEYEQTSGRKYGAQRIDTGYDFNADAKDLLTGSAFRSCAAVQDHNRFWFAFDGPGGYRPSPLLMPGCTYTLWDSDNGTLETPLPSPNDTDTATPYNTDYPGYDVTHRAEFRSKDNKPVDGSDVLLLHRNRALMDNFAITDDLPLMDEVLGKPCWIFAENAGGVLVPRFSRYITLSLLPPFVETGEVLSSLDFGVPSELDIPGLYYPVKPTVWFQRWRRYLSDRLSVHNKVLRCRVDFSGLQVGMDLFRRFWWWRGSLWVLNKLSNYSMTTFDPAECEFVQVRDIDNYTS